jgi:hypothetical protein
VPAPHPIAVRKRAELQAKLDALPRELETWRSLSADETSRLARHHTQIRRLAAQVEGLQETIADDVRRLTADEELLQKTATIEKRLLAVQAVWDYFRSKLVLRAQEPFATFLQAADAFAWACYAPMLARHGKEGTDRREPPLVALQGEWSPFALPRGRGYEVVRSPGGWTDTAAFVEVIAALPVPIVGVPWLHLEHLPDLLILAHEVGHIVEHDFDLEGQVGAAIEDALTRERGGQHLEAWSSWRAEAFADLFACAAAGPEFVWTLMDMLARRGQDISAESPNLAADWGAYPTTSLRVLLNAAGLEVLGYAPDATSVRNEWLACYPAHALPDFEPDLPVIARAVLTTSGVLPSDLAFSRTGTQMPVAARQLRQNLPLAMVAALQDPRAIVAAASVLHRQQPATDHRDRWQAARRHIVHVRPPGLLGDDGATEAVDEDADRKAGATRAKTFFDALEMDE